MPAAEEESATLQTRLEAVEDATGDGGVVTGAPWVDDPAALLAHLDASGHFHRDSRAGRIYHAGMVSLRENVPTDSLHVSVDGNHLKAHVDHASPLVESEGTSRYSVPRALVHNLVGMVHDVLTVVRGRQGDHACKLDCEWVSPEAGATPRVVPLLDPKTSAWGLQLDARVAGSLDEARLQTALDTLVGREGAGETCLTAVDCADDEALDAARRELHTAGPPLTVVPPFHVLLAHHPAGDVLMLNLNHAAVDGFGAARVLERLARAYAGTADADAALDFLACADLPVQPAAPRSSRLVRLGRKGVERLRDALSKPPRVADDEAADEPGYGFHLCGLSAQATRDATGGGGGATRDALVAALHLTIARWNSRHAMPGRRIGVLVPVDLRPADLPAHVVANLSVNTRLSTTRRERLTPTTVLRAVKWHSERDEATRTGISLIAALERAGMLALWAKQSSIVLQPLVDNRRADAAMLCDLGSLPAAPSFGGEAGEVTELWFSPPSRSPRCLCVGTVTLEGRLYVTFRYPHALFGPSAVRRFADLYLSQLERVSGKSA
ncbi:MAG TPA: hypothetical protein VGV90_17375 [Solirubrobacteraceae bacterium]|nr:hypothetical protein [Solirubrobacteraceae bacterium]